MNDITIPNTGQLSVFSPDGFALVQRMAMAFAKSTLVPKHYQGEAGISNCIIALNMAQRIGSDPLMTMQSLYIVHGTPAWSSQFLIATFNSSGRFQPIRYRFEGKPGTLSWGCRAITADRETGEEIEGTLVTLQTAKDEGWIDKNGSKWKTMPEQMLKYRAAAWMVRSTAPEIAMGLHTAEEVSDTYEKPVQPRRIKSANLAAEILGEPDHIPEASKMVEEAEEPKPEIVDEKFPPTIVEEYADMIRELLTVEECEQMEPIVAASKKLKADEKKQVQELLADKKAAIEKKGGK